MTWRALSISFYVPDHMLANLEVSQLRLNQEQIEVLDNLVGAKPDGWRDWGNIDHHTATKAGR